MLLILFLTAGLILAPAQAVRATGAPSAENAATAAAAPTVSAAAATDPAAATAMTTASPAPSSTPGSASAGETATAAAAATPAAAASPAAAATAAAALPSPTPAPALNSLVLAAGQLHTLLIHADGQLFAAGDNAYGQLGIGSAAPADGFSPVALPERSQAAAAGAYHSLLLTVSGKVYAFGRNAFGQLGSGTVVNEAAPALVEGLPPAAALAAGAYHSLVLGKDGSVWAFGDNTQGQCGPAAVENVQNESGQLIARRVIRPQRILASGARAIAAGAAHSLILLENGTVLAFGANSHGQLGDGTTAGRNEMLAIAGIRQATMIAAGSDHSLVVTQEASARTSASPGQTSSTSAPASLASSQALFAFGDNSLGQLGSGSDYALDARSLAPVRIDWSAAAGAGYEIRLLAAGYGNSLLVAEKAGTSGQAKAASAGGSAGDPRTARVLVWGSNAYGQLGTGDDASHDRPTLLKAADQDYSGDTWLPFEAAAIGGGHVLLASRRGLLGAAGRNGEGQLGFVGGLSEPVFVGVPMPPLTSAPASETLDQVRASAYGQSVMDSRSPAKVLPLQVPWDTAYAFGEDSAPVPPDPRLPFLLTAAALLALAALLGAGLIINHRRDLARKRVAAGEAQPVESAVGQPDQAGDSGVDLES